MDVVRQDSSEKWEKYTFNLNQKHFWEIDYGIFNFADETDKPKGAVRESLVIGENFPTMPWSGHENDSFFDTIYLNFDGTVERYTDEHIGYSPVFERLKKNQAAITEIRKGLSPEARELFDKGLEGYVGR